jgi:hypothetical protein
VVDENVKAKISDSTRKELPRDVTRRRHARRRRYCTTEPSLVAILHNKTMHNIMMHIPSVVRQASNGSPNKLSSVAMHS